MNAELVVAGVALALGLGGLVAAIIALRRIHELRAAMDALGQAVVRLARSRRLVRLKRGGGGDRGEGA